MIVGYGGYRFPQNSVAVSISRTALKTQGGIYYAYNEVWTLKTPPPGLFDTTQQALTTDLIALTNAFSVDGYDLVLYLDDGVTPTAHALYSAQCNGGTRVLNPPQFPDGTGAQYSTYRTFEISIAGEVPIITGNIYTRFQERIVVQGTGGPVTVWIPVAQGPYVQQLTAQTSLFRIIQNGRAEGLYGPVAVAPPIWPAAEVQQLRLLEEDSPIMRNGRYYNYGCSWSYTFQSSGQLSGQPNFYPQ